MLSPLSGFVGRLNGCNRKAPKERVEGGVTIKVDNAGGGALPRDWRHHAPVFIICCSDVKPIMVCCRRTGKDFNQSSKESRLQSLSKQHGNRYQDKQLKFLHIHYTL